MLVNVHQGNTALQNRKGTDCAKPFVLLVCAASGRLRGGGMVCNALIKTLRHQGVWQDGPRAATFPQDAKVTRMTNTGITVILETIGRRVIRALFEPKKS